MSRLGRLHELIPWGDLVSLLPERHVKKGPTPYFDRKGMLALMFLKHDTGLCDRNGRNVQ